MMSYVFERLHKYLLADKFGQASVGTHDKYVQDQPWSSLLIACIMLPALIDLLFPKLCWQNVPVPTNNNSI